MHTARETGSHIEGSRTVRPLSHLQIAKTWHAPIRTASCYSVKLKRENRPGSHKDRFQANEKGTREEKELPTLVQRVSEGYEAATGDHRSHREGRSE